MRTANNADRTHLRGESVKSIFAGFAFQCLASGTVSLRVCTESGLRCSCFHIKVWVASSHVHDPSLRLKRTAEVANSLPYRRAGRYISVSSTDGAGKRSFTRGTRNANVKLRENMSYSDLVGIPGVAMA